MNRDVDTSGLNYAAEAIRIIRRIKNMEPDLRLGQIIDNAIGKKDLYYISDKELLDSLKAFEEIISSYRKKKDGDV